MALEHRGINLGNLECGICGSDVETVNHLTVECTLVKAVWWHVFNWIKISVSAQVSDFNGLLDEVYKHKGSKIWKKKPLKWFCTLLSGEFGKVEMGKFLKTFLSRF
ncbi:putative reverse transcriptase zinc-binding domain-containing protein [Helianthus annuus]|nr:putative reverse transcriptase zinc-binding domain-containing protein [Helianthus annuus]